MSYVQAILAVRDNPLIDVCFCVGRPYDSFDIAASKCSFTRENVDCDPLCLQALETGVSDICPESIVLPNATLERMLKYNRYAGIWYKVEQVLLLCSLFKVDGVLARKVLEISR